MATKYQEVADTVRKRIENGTYKVGELIPDQTTLAAEFKVNRLTVKKALDGLASEGLIYKQSGLGTYVRGKIPFVNHERDVTVDDFRGAYQEFGPDRIKSDVLTFDVQLPDERIQKNLNIKRIDPVYEVKRIRIIDGEPTVLEHTYMPVKLVPELSKEVCEKSIYTYIHDELGHKFGNAFRKFSALGADDEDVKELNVEKGSPILEVEQVVWLTNGKSIEYSTSHVPGNKRSYTVMNINNFN